jgi:Reverse transcriptase (RNA-dependent DNA polymerase)
MRNIPYETHLERAKRTMHGPQEENLVCQSDGNEIVARDTEVDDFLGLAEDDPRTYREATQAYDASDWETSYDDELKSMKQHRVWTLIPHTDVPQGRRILGSWTVFLRKRNEHNEVTRCKTRIVAKGYSQVDGIDYTDTFAPMARLESVRTVLSIVASLDWEIHQFDIKTAFLHGDLTEDLYMEQPEGRKEKGKETWVCKLHKSLYGLRQAGRCWYTRLYDEMCKAGFVRVSVDHSVFVKHSDSGHAMITVHVDDMAAAASNSATLQKTIQDLRNIINIVDMGPIKWFLGMAVMRDRTCHTITLSQATYIDTILKRFKMEDSYTVSTPLDPNVTLDKSMSPQSDEERKKMKGIPYLAGVGSLMYASMATQPDITYATNKLSQFNADPGLPHWTALQQVLRYLKRTRNLALTLGGTIKPRLTGYTDSDYAGCTDTRQSTSGYIFTLGCGSVSWSSKRQSIVTTSSCKAEYVASCHATKEAMWLRRLLELLGFRQSTTTIHSDNAGSISLTKDAAFHARSKHIDVQFHYTCERVTAGDILFKYLPTADMPADIMTKALARPKHDKFVMLLGLSSHCDDSPSPQ